MQGDTIIPDPGNTQDWDRYSYSINNPLRYTDPSGHCAGSSNDPNNPDKPCWDLYHTILDKYNDILDILDPNFNYAELVKIFGSLHMTSNMFHNDLDAFKAAFGTFSIIRFPTDRFGASGITPPGLNIIYLSDKYFSLGDVIHEIGHIFDFRSSSGDGRNYKSQSFVNMFGNGCKVGMLGCVSNNKSYCFLNNGRGCGDWNPIVHPNLGTTVYGARSSVDDFADSFVSYVLINNRRDPDRYKVSYLRRIIIDLWINKATP